MKNKYNVVVLGKSGVGKSSFINYLYGKKVAKTGTGKPVTELGFHPIDFKLDEMDIRLYDTWGLEAGKSKKWSEYLEKELKNRSYEYSVNEWFHTVFYCISGGGHRIEQFELDTINKFICDKYAVTVVLTKADQTTHDELEQLKKTLYEKLGNNLVVIPVCSEEKLLIGGNKTRQFGKKEIEYEVYMNFWKSIKSRLPRRCEKILLNKLSKWKKEQERYIEQETGIWNEQDIEKELIKQAKKLVNDINTLNDVKIELKKTVETYDFSLKN